MVGVGNNPEPITTVTRANGTSRKAMPEQIVPERGQAADVLFERFSLLETEDGWHLFHEDPFRLQEANDSQEEWK